jgi:hypothetical protein
MVDEAERLRCLSAAITCAVLAPAGPQRSRILATLYKDERASQNLPTDFAILEKMHFLRLLSPGEVSEFAKSLAPHQLALLPGDGGSQVSCPFLCIYLLFMNFYVIPVLLAAAFPFTSATPVPVPLDRFFASNS